MNCGLLERGVRFEGSPGGTPEMPRMWISFYILEKPRWLCELRKRRAFQDGWPGTMPHGTLRFPLQM